MPTEISSPSEPATEELVELVELRERLEEHARENSFTTVLERVPLGGDDPDWQLDLVLRPAGMFAATTGYVFLPVVLPEHVAEFGRGWKKMTSSKERTSWGPWQTSGRSPPGSSA
jgi:hypothetical protein